MRCSATQAEYNFNFVSWNLGYKIQTHGYDYALLYPEQYSILQIYTVHRTWPKLKLVTYSDNPRKFFLNKLKRKSGSCLEYCRFQCTPLYICREVGPLSSLKSEQTNYYLKILFHLRKNCSNFFNLCKLNIWVEFKNLIISLIKQK